MNVPGIEPLELMTDQPISRTQLRQTLRDREGEPIHVYRETGQLLYAIAQMFPEGVIWWRASERYRVTVKPENKE